MRLGGRRESSNVEDRRGDDGGFGGGGGFGRGRMPIGFPTGGGARSGGIGIVGILIILGIMWLLGINPLELLNGGGGSSGGRRRRRRPRPARHPARSVHRRTRAASSWRRSSATPRTPGPASSSRPAAPIARRRWSSSTARRARPAASPAPPRDPFYCPNDQKLYIDLAFYDELKSKFGAPGDFAEAYVIAHEVGHHVQNLLGILPKVDSARRNASEEEANALSVRLELQADCLAGVWGHEADQEGILDPGDIDEALNAAAAIGDDTLQKRGQGYVVPESFTHGTSEQRLRWFKRGFDQGKIDACDTFGASQV